MMEDRAFDGTPLDPKRDFEDEYQRLNQRYDDLNRTMFKRYIQFLDAPRPPIERKRKADNALTAVDESPSTAARKENDDTATFQEHETAEKDATTSVHETASEGSSVVGTSDEPLCPYVSIAALPTPPPTSPQFDTITLTDTGNQALLMQGQPVPINSESVTAIADSGASHVLIRASDAHILHNKEVSANPKNPYAVLKAANHATITAIGRGTLLVQHLAVTAYIFRDSDLANNLLGLVPFANLGCSTTFRPKSFHITHRNRTPVITGRRESVSALWTVSLTSNQTPHQSDGIPPPSRSVGIYVEANAITLQDNASYVKFVHAALGYPSPSTFLNAVRSGFITGSDQFPRLTTKMIRKHWPNDLATARGHLDRTPSGQPHANSEAASARKRKHTITTRQDAAIAMHKQQANLQTREGDSPTLVQPFNLGDMPRSQTIHLDYTGPLPDVCTSGARYFQVSCWGGIY